MIKYLKKNLIICLIVSPFVSMAQMGNTLNKRSIGITFEPNFGYRLLNFSSVNSPIATERNANEIGRFGFTTGIDLKRKISKNSLFSYGLYYSRFGYDTRLKPLNFQNSNSDYPIRSKTAYFYESVGVPLTVHYHFTKRKFNPYIKLGVQGDFIIQKTAITVLEYNNGDETNAQHIFTLGFQPFNLSALIGVGIEYNINNKFTIAAEPLVKQSLTSLNADKTAKEKPYSIGLGVKMFYHFKK